MLSACAEQPEGLGGPLTAGSRPARAARSLCVCHGSGPDAVGCAEQRERREQGPSPPGLARLGQHTTSVCGNPVLVAVSAAKGGGGGGSLPACLGAGLACRDARLGLRIDYALHGSEAVDGAKQREEGRRRPPHRDAGPRPAWAAYRPCVCRGPLMLTAMPSSETEGGGSLPAEPHSARVTHSVCVCPSSAAPSSEREGGRAPSHRASPGSGRAPRFVCRGRDAVGCAKQRGRRQSPPTRQVSPGTGRARPGATP